MQLPKFIVTLDGHLRIGMCYLHTELLQPGDSCIGGGFYDIDYLSDVLILNRKSHDFGEPGGISSTNSMFPGHMPVSASNTYMPTDITRISMSATSSTSNIIDY